MQLIIDSSAIAEIYTVPASSSPAWCGKEIGHALLHDPEYVTTKDLSRGLKELEAESTAYVICTALGMDTSDYSFGYVLGWTGRAPDAIEGIKASTGRIQKAATTVLKTFEVEQTRAEIANGRLAARDMKFPINEREMENPVELDRASTQRAEFSEVNRSNHFQPLSAAELELLDSTTYWNLGIAIGVEL